MTGQYYRIVHSRRKYLAGAGSALLSASAGCLSAVMGNRTQTEYIQYKMILVDLATDEHHVSEKSLLRLLSRSPGELRGHVAKDHADIVDADGRVSVSEERHRSFEAAYAGVRYAVSFCGGDLDSDGETGCRGTNISREQFDEIQFGDSVTVDFDGTDEVAATVTDVESGSTDGWDIEIETVAFPDEAE